jgi:hypothetical protein
MTDLFNAKDAKKLSSLNDPNELLKIILEEIKEKASEGKWEYTTRSYGFGDSILYGAENNYPDKILQILKSLRNLGFDVDVKSIESQFVDIYLHVTWF